MREADKEIEARGADLTGHQLPAVLGQLVATLTLAQHAQVLHQRLRLGRLGGLHQAPLRLGYAGIASGIGQEQGNSQDQPGGGHLGQGIGFRVTPSGVSHLLFN